MKANELRAKTPSELNQMIFTVTRELFDLRIQKGINETQMKSHHFRRVRRLIARIKTILIEKAKTA